ncbi:MAG: RNA polymerase sigma factor [Actinobacteria bacterium]|nr:RNA polymerase sigma factor [Actinomycetota bacterium]
MAESVGRPSFEDFVLRRSEALQRFAYLVTGNREDARDVVQEALIGLYPRWERVTDRAEAYARRSILNANVSRWRKVGAELLAFEPDAAPADPSDPYRTVDDRDAAARLFVTLPVRQRAALVMRFYEQASYAEIAEALGTAEATARSLVHRALTSLRSTLQEGGDA